MRSGGQLEKSASGISGFKQKVRGAGHRDHTPNREERLHAFSVFRESFLGFLRCNAEFLGAIGHDLAPLDTN